jgi:hypothetical protein
MLEICRTSESLYNKGLVWNLSLVDRELHRETERWRGKCKPIMDESGQSSTTWELTMLKINVGQIAHLKHLSMKTELATNESNIPFTNNVLNIVQ